MLLWIAAGALALTAGVYYAGEWLSVRWDTDVRGPVYRGALAGAVLALSGLPFAWLVKRAAPHDSSGAQTWKWWGSGILVRMALLLLFTQPLLFDLFPRHPITGRTTMIAVYLAIFFAEVIWLANVLLKSDAAMKTPKA